MKYSNRIKYFISISLLSSLCLSLPAVAPGEVPETQPIERYALYIASNNGGTKRETLKYAGTDAIRLAQTMNEIGGIKPENGLILTDPTKAQIAEAFGNFKTLLEKNKGTAKRTEFLFYYSGHSDENAFLLGDEAYDYLDLKNALGTVPSDVHVVMLDSCFSGNFIRTKGGSRQKAFLMDDSTIVQGHAYLSSSSENEASQESDKIQASYFTQALITGLRGGADSSGDGKVSLNELYYYAFNETLSSTEKSAIGPQHPSYNITLVGSGDLVLTDLSEAEASIYIPADAEGIYFFRNKDNILVSEINKIKGTEIALALPAGFYTVTLVNESKTRQRNIVLQKGERIPLEAYTFSTILQTPGRARGDVEPLPEKIQEEPIEEEIVWTPLSVSIFPGVAFSLGNGNGTDNVNISAGLFMVSNKRIFGVQASAFSGSVTKDLYGVQASGFMNNNSGTGRGIQAAGFMNNISGNLYGVQSAGFMNNSSGAIRGAQAAGFMNNVSGMIQGVQAAGFMNNTSGTLSGVQAAGFMNNASGKVTGIQTAGFQNTASRGFTGLQAAGFLNIASSNSTGIQASGFLNIAGHIDGVQVGIVNIARNNTGVSLGILNIIVEGIISPSVYKDNHDIGYIQYQGGTPMFFTTFLAGTKTDWQYEYGVFGFGIGSRFKSSNVLSLDLEIIGKHIVDFSDEPSYYDNLTATNYIEARSAELQLRKIYISRSIPSARATLNLSFFKHLGVFAAFTANFNIIGYNDEAFTYWKNDKSYVITENVVQFYPTVSFGIRL